MPTQSINTHNHTVTHTLWGALKKIAAILVALGGIAFILWLDSWFMNHADMPELGSIENNQAAAAFGGFY